MPDWSYAVGNAPCRRGPTMGNMKMRNGNVESAYANSAKYKVAHHIGELLSKKKPYLDGTSGPQVECVRGSGGKHVRKVSYERTRAVMKCCP